MGRQASKLEKHQLVVAGPQIRNEFTRDAFRELTSHLLERESFSWVWLMLSDLETETGQGEADRVRIYCLRSDLSETMGVERLPGKGHASSALYVGERLKVRERFELRCGSAFLAQQKRVICEILWSRTAQLYRGRAPEPSRRPETAIPGKSAQETWEVVSGPECSGRQGSGSRASSVASCGAFLDSGVGCRGAPKYRGSGPCPQVQERWPMEATDGSVGSARGSGVKLGLISGIPVHEGDRVL